MKSQEFAITRLGESMLDSPLLRTDFIPDNATVAFDSEAARLAEYRNGRNRYVERKNRPFGRDRRHCRL